MKKTLSRQHIIFEQLEPRFLFSADLAPVPFDAGLFQENILFDSPLTESENLFYAESLLPDGVDSIRHEILFIDANVSAYQQLIDGLMANDDRQIEVILLDGSSDGIDQITQTLNTYQDIDAVHIISHASNGAVQLGDSWLSIDNTDTYADSIASWHNALTDDADLLFYGCSLAETDTGQSLINTLSTLTGADVTASDDLTGHEELGGDWLLEYSSGSIETEVAVNTSAQQDWQVVLVAPTNTITSAVFNPTAKTLILTGTGFDTIATIGTDVKSYMDWDKFVWDINGDDGTTTDITFTATEFSSVEITSDTVLTLNLTAAKTNQIVATTDFGADGGTDTIDITAGFSVNVSDEAAATDALVDGALSLGDLPIAIDNTISTGEDTTYTFTVDDFNFFDPNGAGLDHIQITSLETAGALKLSGVDVALNDTIDATDIDSGYLTFTPTADESGLAYADFEFKVYDGTNYSTIPTTMTIDVDPINDAPGATNISQIKAYTEDDASVALDDIVVTDVDTNPVQVITATLTLDDISTGVLTTGTFGAASSSYDTVSGIWTVTGSVIDVNAALAAVSFTPASNNDINSSIATHIEDQDGLGPVDGVISLNVTPVNDAPTLSIFAAPVETVDEDTEVEITFTELIIQGDEADIDGTVDAFVVKNVTSGTLRIGADSASALVWDAVTNNTIDATSPAYWTPDSNVNGTFNAFSVVALDDNNAESVGDINVQVKVNDINNAPPTALNLNAPETFTEDKPLNLTNIIVTDIDSSNVTASMTLSNMSAGTLSTGNSGSVTSYFAGGVWNASGPVADVNNLLADVIFTPSANYDSDFTITTSISDGIAPAVTGLKNMAGIAVGDTPEVASISTDSFSQSGLIVISRNPDDGPEVTHFRISGITNGSLYLADGVTEIHDGDFITYTQGQAGVRFTPDSDADGNGSFGVESSENGSTVSAQSGVAHSTITTTPPDVIPVTPISPVTIEPDSPVESPSVEEEPSDTSEDETVVETVDDSSDEESKDKEITNVPQDNQEQDKFSLDFRQANIASMYYSPVAESESTYQGGQGDPETESLSRVNIVEQAMTYKQRSELEYKLMRNSLNDFKEETLQEYRLNRAFAGSAIAASTGLSVGYVVWLLRGGALLSSVLSSMPAWQLADPLPILAGRRGDSTADDEDSLEGIIKKGSQPDAKETNADAS